MQHSPFIGQIKQIAAVQHHSSFAVGGGPAGGPTFQTCT